MEKRNSECGEIHANNSCDNKISLGVFRLGLGRRAHAYLKRILWLPIEGYKRLLDFERAGLLGGILTVFAKAVAVAILAGVIFFGVWGFYCWLIQPSPFIWLDYVKYAVWWLFMLGSIGLAAYIYWLNGLE